MGLFVKNYLTTPYINANVIDHMLFIVVSALCEYASYCSVLFQSGLQIKNRRGEPVIDLLYLQYEQQYLER